MPRYRFKLFLGVSVRVFLEEILFKSTDWAKWIALSNMGACHSTLRAWREGKDGGRENLPFFLPGHLSWNIDLLLPSDWNLYHWLSWFSQSGWNDSLALPGLQLANCSFLDFSASIITWEPVVCVCMYFFSTLVLLL